jgi:SAM-dependent methyltransferase
MDTVPYDEWAEYVVTLLETIDYHPRTILDLACGTGNIALRLARLGLEVSGIDGSAAMVAVAQKKALAEHLSVRFSQGDFRTFTLEEPVELVISLYDSLNYLLTEEDLAQAFQQVERVLCPQGYFIFDLNTIKRLVNVEEGNSRVEGDEYYLFWNDRVEQEVPYWHVRLTIFEKQPDESLFREDETHTERAYPISRVTELLQTTGFAVEGIYDEYTMEPGSEESGRIIVVARKMR